jgi:16S rRNA (uracil1498-N3)-methyltransferase
VLQKADVKECRLEIVKGEYTPLASVEVGLAVAPTKQIDRMEWLVEKATEMGVSSITFLRTRNSERRDINMQRLTKVMVAAMKQSLQSRMPLLGEMTDLQELIARPIGGLKAIACCSGVRRALPEVCRKGQPLCILIGAEGDFTEEERLMAHDNGFLAVSLGENRLRTETAALLAAWTGILLCR